MRERRAAPAAHTIKPPMCSQQQHRCGGVPTPTDVPGRSTAILAALIAYFGGLAVLNLTNGPRWLAVPLVLLATALLAMGFLPRTPLTTTRWPLQFQWAVFTTSALMAGWLVIPTLTAPAVRSDQWPSIQCAAQSVLAGSDPWQESEVQCMASLSLHTADLTPLRSGPFAHQPYPPKAQILRVEGEDQATHTSAGFPDYGYPPLAAVWILPVAHAGLKYVSWYVVAILLVMLALSWARHLPAAMVPLGAQLLVFAIFLSGFNGDPEVLGYAALVCSYLWLDRPRASSVWLSIAVLSNPLCWVALPGWLGIVLGEADRRRRVGWLFGATAALLLPWLTWDHSLLAELWRFATLPEFPIGFSIAALTNYPYPPSQAFLAMFVAVVVALAVLAWRRPRYRWLCAAVVWTAFLVNWRGNAYYLLPLFWLSPAILAGWHSTGRRPNGGAGDFPGSRPTVPRGLGTSIGFES